MAFFKRSTTEQLLAALRKGDRYRTLAHIGEGGISDVESAFDHYLNRIVAVKKLKKKHLNIESVVRFFMNEIKLISYLDHPGVVSIFDAFLDEDKRPCYTMKVVRGVELSSVLESKTPTQLLDIFVKLCQTLGYVHSKGVIHLDLKPANIMLGDYGEVMIMDWGSARLYDPGPYGEYLKEVPEAQGPLEECAGISSGTPAYMSPEQTTASREALTPSSDIFSLGVIFYQMMSRRMPFTGTDTTEIFRQVRDCTPPALYRLKSEIPHRLSHICTRMLKKDPFDRYHGFHEVLSDMDAFRSSGMAFPVHTYQQGETIFREGDPGTFAFTILSGAVEISRVLNGRKMTLAMLGENEIVGELAIFNNQPRSATVRAAAPNTVIRVMDRKDVEDDLDKLSPWVDKMIRGLSRRFVDLNTLIAEIDTCKARKQGCGDGSRPTPP